MNAVLWIFIAIAFGLMLFSSIQDDIPEELSVLRDDSVPVKVPKDGKKSTYEGWTIVQSPAGVELLKMTRPTQNAKGGSSPYIGILCSGNAVSLRIDAKRQLDSASGLAVHFNGGATAWHPAQGANIVAGDPKGLIRFLVDSKDPVSVSLKFSKGGLQTYSFNPKGLEPLYNQLPQGCR